MVRTRAVPIYLWKYCTVPFRGKFLPFFPFKWKAFLVLRHPVETHSNILLSILYTTDNNAVDTNACEQREPDETRKGYNRSTRLCSPPILGCTNPCYLIPVPDFDDECKKYAETTLPYRMERLEMLCSRSRM